MTTYSTRTNAVRAARKALGADRLSDVHFRVTEAKGAELARQEGREDEADATIANERLEEIAADPTLLVSGAELEAALADPLVVDGVRFPNLTRANEARRLIDEAPSRSAAPVEATAAAKTPKHAKRDEVLALLKRPEGASVADIQAITGWLPHTARAFLSVTPKKLGLQMTTEKVDKRTVYRVAA
jgi:hypothetical protein